MMTERKQQQLTPPNDVDLEELSATVYGRPKPEVQNRSLTNTFNDFHHDTMLYPQLD